MDPSKNNSTQITIARKQLDSFGLKKRGMGKGLWNGNGGKVEPDESKIQGTYLHFFRYFHDYILTFSKLFLTIISS